MSNLFLSLVLIALVALVEGNKFYFSFSPQSIPGNYSTWLFNTDSNQLSQLSTGLEEAYSAWTMVSGSAQCGSRYYASAVDAPIAAAMLITDLGTGKTNIFDWNNFGVNLNLHNMYCDTSDESGQTLYVVESVVGGHEYSLYKMKIDDDYNFSQEKIGDFVTDNTKTLTSTGYDTQFQVSPDLKTAFALWTNSQMLLGFVQKMDTSTGEVTTFQLDEKKVPYALLVDSTGSMEIIVSHSKQASGINQYSKCQLTLNNGKGELNQCKDDSNIFLGGQPWTQQFEDGNFYAMSHSSADQSIVTLKSDGSISDSLAMNEVFKNQPMPHGTYGGLAVAV
jgi:hypothetical protein